MIEHYNKELKQSLDRQAVTLVSNYESVIPNPHEDKDDRRKLEQLFDGLLMEYGSTLLLKAMGNVLAQPAESAYTLSCIGKVILALSEIEE